jgi:hypothetical protein
VHLNSKTHLIMRKVLILTPIFLLVCAGTWYAYAFIHLGGPASFKTRMADEKQLQVLKEYAAKAKIFTAQNGYNTKLCFLLNMALPSGQKRFFVYNMVENKVVYAGLVAHGSCNYEFLTDAKFSNRPGCGCSAKGKYKIGYKYTGRFGAAYKLYGLDSTNSNAYDRFIVLHSYYMVPDKETAPFPICNSLGCAMVSKAFLAQLEPLLDASTKPVLLWMFE